MQLMEDDSYSYEDLIKRYDKEIESMRDDSYNEEQMKRLEKRAKREAKKASMKDRKVPEDKLSVETQQHENGYRVIGSAFISVGGGEIYYMDDSIAERPDVWKFYLRDPQFVLEEAPGKGNPDEDKVPYGAQVSKGEQHDQNLHTEKMNPLRRRFNTLRVGINWPLISFVIEAVVIYLFAKLYFKRLYDKLFGGTYAEAILE